MENQGNTLINTEKMRVYKHSLVTIKFSIPKLYENTPFHSFNVTHAGTKNHQVTRTLIENQGNTLICTEKIEFDIHALLLIKNRLHH